MNRVEAAIHDGRCVLALGSQLLADNDVLMEIRRRTGLPMVALGGQATELLQAVSEDSLSPCLDKQGGVLVLVEPDAAQDGRGLNAIAALVQKARNKPRLVVAARAFNPFLMPMALRMLKMEQERKRARDFLGTLPTPVATSSPAPGAPAAPATPVAKPKKKKKEAKKGPRAPRVGFSGREQELSDLANMLGDGGPIVVAGPQGIGCRWLIERCLAESPLRRLPDVALDWTSAADHLYARLAQATQDAGDKRLAKAMRSASNRPPPAELAQLAVECLRAEGLSDAVMVVHVNERLMRDDGSMHRRGRLELLLEALLANRYAPRLVFTTPMMPVSYREGGYAALRGLVLGGLKGKELYEIFDAYRFSDAPRDKMGELHARVFGHPLAVRTVAVAAQGAKEPAAAIADGKIVKLASLDDLEPLAKRLHRRLSRLGDEQRKILATIAHLQHPAPAALLQELGVKRDDRISLLARGLLESTPCEGSGRRYYVHAMVARQLTWREVNDFPTFEMLGHAILELHKRAAGSEKLALGLEANRCLLMARRGRSAIRLSFPDQDAEIESVRGLLRARQPRLDLAEQRLRYLTKADPGNTEALLLEAECLVASKAPEDKIQSAFERAAQSAPTPEVFHLEANWHQQRGKKEGLDQAIATLQRGSSVFPTNGRLRRRLAGLLLDARRDDEALAVLEETMALEPMMPDTYGLLGQILLRRGPASWEKASEYLEEALRLAPDDPVHLTRQGTLLRQRGLIDREQRDEHWSRAVECFERAIQGRRRNHDALRQLATLLLERQNDEDIDRIAWLLDKAAKPSRSQKRGKPRGRAPRPDKVLEARLAARRGRVHEAEAVLERLVQRDPKNHRARAAWAEVLYAKSRVFKAHAEYQRAQQDAPPDAVERLVYEGAIEQLQALIESGQAIELERQADQAALERPVATQAEPDQEGAAGQAGGTRRRTRRRSGRVRLVDASTGLTQVPGDETAVPDHQDDAANTAVGSGEE